MSGYLLAGGGSHRGGILISNLVHVSLDGSKLLTASLAIIFLYLTFVILFYFLCKYDVYVW